MVLDSLTRITRQENRKLNKKTIADASFTEAAVEAEDLLIS